MSLICPKCQSEMISYERAGVTVDQCTGCRGLFLDRGELQQLSEAEKAYHAGPMGFGGQAGGPGPGGHVDKKTKKYWKKQHRKHKRRSFMENLFEFGGGGGD